MIPRHPTKIVKKKLSNCNSQKEKENPSNSNENKNNCKKDETTIKIDDDETIVPLPSDAEILFTIAGKVQIFYINADGNASAPSYPSTLFIFKLKSEYSQCAGAIFNVDQKF